MLGLGALPNFNERTGYVGVLPLLFALFAVVCRRCKFTIFHLSLTLISLLIIYGVPPFPAILRVLPVLCSINQTRLLLFTSFSVAVLAGLGWDTFSRMEERRKAIWLVLGFWAAVGAALLWLASIIGPNFHALDSSHRAFLTGQCFILSGSAVASGVVVLWRARWRRWVPMMVCLGGTAVDLLWFGIGYNPAIPRDRYYPLAPAVEWLKMDASTFRILGGGTAPFPNTAAVFGLSERARMRFHERAAL